MKAGPARIISRASIHEIGPRRDAPFLKIDCASLPPQLVESELFGHESGAFTGAVERKLGRFELGGDGTIVLDEVAALSPVAQSKMLRVLQERAFERLGGNETLRIEARLIALTNVDLQRRLWHGSFREDLFFRLNVLTFMFLRCANVAPIFFRSPITCSRRCAEFMGAPTFRLVSPRVPCSLPTRGREMFANCAMRWSGPWFSLTARR